MEIIGRLSEKEILRNCYESNRPEFLAVYGRRRVGKTFLIREYFAKDLLFYFTGEASAENRRQLANFDEALLDHGLPVDQSSTDWHQAFSQLKRLIQTSSEQKKVVFIDELPWLAAPQNDFVQALEYFWNSWASAQPDLLLIICGSATSWIFDNIISEHGGLHNRVTRQIPLAPFSLGESEAFMQSRGIVYNRYQIAETYMVLGGVPYYLDYLESDFSPAQNIDRMFFASNAPLKREFNDLYRSLFQNPDNHIRVIEALGKRPSGLVRDEIIKETGISAGGRLSKTLIELEQCGFIQGQREFTRRKNGKYYKLSDFFSRFYLRFLADRPEDEHYWQNKSLRGEQLAWYGVTFEQLCAAHVGAIKQKLGISGVSTTVSAWRSKLSQPMAQIDLVIDRADNIINLCEMKFSTKPFVIDKEYDMKLRERRETFREETKTRKALHTTLVTTYGISRNAYIGEVQSEVTLDDLFIM